MSDWVETDTGVERFLGNFHAMVGEPTKSEGCWQWEVFELPLVGPQVESKTQARIEQRDDDGTIEPAIDLRLAVGWTNAEDKAKHICNRVLAALVECARVEVDGRRLVLDTEPGAGTD